MALRCRAEGARDSGAGKGARQGSGAPFIGGERYREGREREGVKLGQPAMMAIMAFWRPLSTHFIIQLEEVLVISSG